MKSDIKEAVMVYEKARMYAYLSAEITSLYHEAAVKIGISDTVLNILYVLCEKEGQCLQRDIFRLTGISRQTINSAIRKLERDGIAYRSRCRKPAAASCCWHRPSSTRR